jgi:hypothetical protein
VVLIANFRTGTQSIRPHTGVVDAYIQVVEPLGPSPRVHISTFGSTERTSAPKSSQSLQLDSSSAALLVGHLREAFGPDWLSTICRTYDDDVRTPKSQTSEVEATMGATD